MINTSRGSGIFNPIEFREKAIHIIGLGNIGSHTAIALTRMGFQNFILYDFDKVEDVNVSTQAFSSKHEGMEKTEAVAEQMKDINPDCKIRIEKGEINEGSKGAFEKMEDTLCFISGVDSLKARGGIKRLLEASAYKDIPVIDGRMGKQQVEVHFAKNAKEWDVEVAEDILAKTGCTKRFIAYTPLMCAALISGTAKRLCLEEEIPDESIFEFQSNHYLRSN